jgi:hypothetical protein
MPFFSRTSGIKLKQILFLIIEKDDINQYQSRRPSVGRYACRYKNVLTPWILESRASKEWRGKELAELSESGNDKHKVMKGSE